MGCLLEVHATEGAALVIEREIALWEGGGEFVCMELLCAEGAGEEAARVGPPSDQEQPAPVVWKIMG